jgi:hypothetical protein
MKYSSHIIFLKCEKVKKHDPFHLNPAMDLRWREMDFLMRFFQNASLTRKFICARNSFQGRHFEKYFLCCIPT